MATILALAVGSFGAIGMCLLVRKYRAGGRFVAPIRRISSDDYGGTSSEKQPVLLRTSISPNRKEVQAEKRRLYEEDTLSVIYEGSEAGTQLGSRVNSEDALAVHHEATRLFHSMTPRSQALSAFDELEEQSLIIDEGETNPNALDEIEDYSIAAFHADTQQQREMLNHVSSQSPQSVVIEKKREISLYEASKSQVKQEVSTHEFSLFIDERTPVPKRSILHESLKYGFVVENVLSPKECDEYIKRTEAIGFTKWTDDEVRLAFRDCDTIEINHPELAELLWQRIKGVMTPQEVDTFIDREVDPERWQRDIEGRWIADGTVNCVLFSRYLEGGHFAIHTDGFNIENFDRRSLFSIVLYLNDVPAGDGGETIFFSNEGKDKMEKDELGRIVGNPDYVVARVKPVAGTATIFFHNILHQSEPIRIGSSSKKYIIRSDVIYARTPPVLTEDRDKEAFAMYQKAEALSDSDPEESARLFRTAFKRSAVLSRIYGM